ncbi:MAG TPA: RluA family pseudouridine synthase [Candidatus Paceibacterota bacterium]|nr:RluA family pseudouridine synthase [Candidatus Paceibacterota bacterium]
MLEPVILYEDDHLLAVNKPAGLMVHTDGRSKEATLADWFVTKYPAATNVGEPTVSRIAGRETRIERPGIVHRLDQDTSGVILLAKDQETFEHLKKQFQEREVTKVYSAFVYGNVKHERGVITRSIGKSKKDPRRRSAQRGARGVMRDAITQYRVLARGEGATYLELRPKTGRTHQIRVHMKALNHPVVCDGLYAPDMPPLLGFSRLALHAASLSFTHPDGREMTIEAPFPDDFVRAQKAIQQAV